MQISLLPAAASAALLMTGLSAQAQMSLGAGLVVTPQFEGSADFTVRAAPNLSYRGEQFSVRSNGPGVEVDMISSRAIDAGPILRYNFGRSGAGIDNAQVSALPDIDGGLEAGGFAQVNIPVAGFNTFLAPRISVVQGVSGGARGTLAQAGVGLVRRQGNWTIGTRISATYASADYMNDRFGVAAGSPSGLAAFSAGAGIKDVGISVFGNYALNERVSIFGMASYSVLMGDAANSPIVSVAGSKDQAVLALGLSYALN